MPEMESLIRVLVVDDEAVVRTGVARILQAHGMDVHLAADSVHALEIMAERCFELALLDIRMPGMDGEELLRRIRLSYPETMVIMITGYPTVDGAVKCLKAGASDYLIKPFRVEDLESMIMKALLKRKKDKGSCGAGSEEAEGIPYIVGKSPVMLEVYRKIRRAAPTDSTVLLMGESGTGKELAARAIHDLSPRADKEFVPVDCSALVESLLESELFGHVKGSFTGAHQTKHGLFELADHGTFFFDEISNLSMNIQAKLLRVIQEREFMKVGTQKRIRLDVRIIASSNKDLREAIKAGTFREDLFYRLSVVPIRLPALKDRTGDLPLLVDHFIGKYSQKSPGGVRGISREAMEVFESYSWPGNVRELEHTIERILILEDGEAILPEHLPSFLMQRRGDFPAFSGDLHSLEEMEKRYIEHVLARTRGKRQEAARILGINRKTLAMKMIRYGIRCGRDEG